jgi:hypothetical protein
VASRRPPNTCFSVDIFFLLDMLDELDTLDAFGRNFIEVCSRQAGSPQLVSILSNLSIPFAWGPFTNDPPG